MVLDCIGRLALKFVTFWLFTLLLTSYLFSLLTTNLFALAYFAFLVVCASCTNWEGLFRGGQNIPLYRRMLATCIQ